MALMVYYVSLALCEQGHSACKGQSEKNCNAGLKFRHKLLQNCLPQAVDVEQQKERMQHSMQQNMNTSLNIRNCPFYYCHALGRQCLPGTLLEPS